MVLLVAIATRISGSNIAGVAVLLLYLGHIVFQLEVFSKRETILFVTLELTAILAWLEIRRSAPRIAALGILAALAHLTRPDGIALIASLCAFELLFSRDGALHSRILRCVGIVGVFLLTISPWALTSQSLTGRLTIASSHNFGQGFYKGHNPYFFDLFPYVDIDLLEPEMERMMGQGDTLYDYRADPFFRQQALQYMDADPWGVLTRSLLKTAVFLCPYPTPFGKSTVEIRDGRAIINDFKWRRSSLGWAAAVFLLLCWAVAGYGLFHANAEVRRLGLLIALILLCMLAIQCITYAEMRYRFPLEVLLMLPAAHGLTVGSKWLLRRRGDSG